MAEMGRYAIDLRSMTQGRGSFTFHFVRYEDAPPAAQEKAIGYTGPPTEPSTAGRLGSGGARERLRNGRQAVPKTADFATTRRCRTRPTNPIRTRAGLKQPGPCMCPYLFT